MKKLILIIFLLSIFVIVGCVINKDITKEIPDEFKRNPPEPQDCNQNSDCPQIVCIKAPCPEQKCINNECKFFDEESQLTNKELCEKQGNVYLSGLSEKCISKEEYQKGINSGGEWKLFSNGCGDSCGIKPRICTLAFSWGVDCGPTKCYDGSICIKDVYEPYSTPLEACEQTGGKWGLVSKEGIKYGCNPIGPVVGICGGLSGEICKSGSKCIYGDGSENAPYPDAQGKCLAILCVDPPLGCNCPEGKIFYSDGCNLPRPDNLFSISLFSIFGGN